MIYKVIERVTYEHVYIVRAEDESRARVLVTMFGEGEAIERNETSRRVTRVEPWTGRRRPVNVIDEAWSYTEASRGAARQDASEIGKAVRAAGRRLATKIERAGKKG